MIRKAFRMSVEPDHQAEYIRRHSPIWPDLEMVLLQHGVQTYSIFLDPATSVWSAKTTAGFPQFRSRGHRLKTILVVQAAEDRFGDDTDGEDPMAAGR